MYKDVSFASLDINQIFYHGMEGKPACKILAAHAQKLECVEGSTGYKPGDFIPMTATECVRVRNRKEFFKRNNSRVLRRKWYDKLPAGAKEYKEACEEEVSNVRG